MEVINCTPHDVNIVIGDTTVVLPASGILPRVKLERRSVGRIRTEHGDIPIVASYAGEVENLPPEVPGVVYIVSALVAQNADRHDLFIVDDTVRDSKGKVIGCRALAIVSNEVPDDITG